MKTVLTAVEMKLELGLEKSAAHSVCFFKARGQRESGRVPYDGHASAGERTKTAINKPTSKDFYAKHRTVATFSP